MNFKEAMVTVGGCYEAMESDCSEFDRRLTLIANMHSPDDNITCEECGKPHPCPTLQAVD